MASPSDHKATIIDCKEIAQTIRSEIASEVRLLSEKYGKVPESAVVIVGNRKDCQSYVNMKRKSCVELGIKSFDIDQPEDIAEAELLSKVHELNVDPDVHDVILSSMAGRVRFTLPLLRKAFCSDSRSALHPALLSNPELSRNYATAPAKEQKVKVPVTMYGVSRNYASALCIAAVKASAFEKVESEILDLIEASKKSPKFSQFMKDLSVPTDIRVKAISDICAQAKFGDLTRNFLEGEVAVPERLYGYNKQARGAMGRK